MPNPPSPVNGRTPDPTPGYRLPLPSYAQAMVQQLAATVPDMRTQSCPRGIKYVNDPWQDYIIDGLRKIDSRWGYNAKPNRTAADNGGVVPDSVLHARGDSLGLPEFKTDDGRIVLGGGGIVPDLIVRQDTFTTAEREFAKAIGSNFAVYQDILTSYASS